MLVAVSYTSDDELIWQISADDALVAPFAGDLPPEAGEPPYPGLWRVRFLRCQSLFVNSSRRFASVACNRSNAAWVLGPGAEILILGERYVVTDTIGENRKPIF